MKIIDAHLHVFPHEEYAERIARAAHHENSLMHLKKVYEDLGIVGGVVMGNRPLEDTRPQYAPFLVYCVGLDRIPLGPEYVKKQAKLVEEHFQNPQCVGLKLYPGYQRFYIYEDWMEPFYELAARYNKPVAVHTGLTASEDALLKYSHPFVLDEAATKFRDVQFVMCHFGEPWYTDAAAVIEKNPNVAVDLSGILEGKIPDFEAFTRKKHMYLERMRGWLEYLDCYDRFMFGTDWPLANLEDYIEFTKYMIPFEHWDDVFYRNAVRIYHLPFTGKEA